MTTRAAVDGQLGMDETVIEDADLEAALEQRQGAKEAHRETGRYMREADEAAKRAIERQELPEGAALRVGRFRVERRTTPGREVSFTVDRGSRLRISVVEADQ